MKNILKNYLNLLNLLIEDFINDLRSFRVQLIYMSYIFNLLVLYAVIFRNLDWKALTISFGTQTIIYAFYFASKNTEYNGSNTPQIKEDEEKAGSSN